MCFANIGGMHSNIHTIVLIAKELVGKKFGQIIHMASIWPTREIKTLTFQSAYGRCIEFYLFLFGFQFLQSNWQLLLMPR